MNNTDYKRFYNKIYRTLKDLTPLKADCGQLCGGACCKGDDNIGMRLFPHEESELRVKELDNSVRLAVCNGSCDRNKRPLACRIFPFFPTIDEKGRIFIEFDYRAYRLCPMIKHCDEIIFDKRFLKAVKKIGKLLAKDKECKAFLYESTEEIDTYCKFFNSDK